MPYKTRLSPRLALRQLKQFSSVMCEQSMQLTEAYYYATIIISKIYVRMRIIQIVMLHVHVFIKFLENWFCGVGHYERTEYSKVIK